MGPLNILILWTFQSTYIESIVKSLVSAGNHVTIIYSENLESYPKLIEVQEMNTRFFIEEGEVPIEIVSQNWHVIFVAGWHKKHFRKFLRQRSDVLRIMYTDTQNERSFNFLILCILFRSIRKLYFDAGFVPGFRQVEFLRRLGFSNENACVGGLAFDDSTFHRTNFTSNARTGPFLYVGRMSSEKNLQNLCLGYNLYRQASSNPREMQLVGPIENFTPQNLPGIRIMGFQDKKMIAQSLNSCRAFLFPSLSEPFGVALLEAAACGAPLLSSPNVGAGDHLITAQNGFIVNPRSPSEICDRLLKFDEWDQSTLEMASRTSQASADFFSPQKWVMRFERLYTGLLERKVSKKRFPNAVVFYLCVIPKYRSRALQLLEERTRQQLFFSACKKSSDSLVLTDDSNQKIQYLNMLNFSNNFFLQTGKWIQGLRSDCLVLDLNPRSLTAWLFLTTRFFSPRKRTLVWGHIHSRFPDRLIKAKIRIFMRYLSDGAVLYTYSDYVRARRDLPKEPVFIAPNSIYSGEFMGRTFSQERNTIIYSGRLVSEKKPELLLRAFKESGLINEEITLVIIGDGPEMSNLKRQAVELAIEKTVRFEGEIFDYSRLREYYAKAIVSVSPGYVGLSLTQSAGFGVPMIVACGENHSPEVELLQSIKHYCFESDQHVALSDALRLAVLESKSPEFEASCEKMAEYVRRFYCAEKMAEGLHSAIFDVSQNLGVEGFPREI
jgi:glycosyltransferase involved in cell wall biosynthesis